LGNHNNKPSKGLNWKELSGCITGMQATATTSFLYPY